MTEYRITRIDEFKDNGRIVQRLILDRCSDSKQELMFEIPPVLTNRFAKEERLRCKFSDFLSDKDAEDQVKESNSDLALLCTVVPTWTKEDTWTLSAGGLIVQVTPPPPMRAMEGNKQWLFVKAI